MNPFGVKCRRAERSSGHVVMRTVSPGASGRPASSAAARAMFAALVIVFAPAEARGAQDPSTDGPMAVVRAFVHANETADLAATLRTFDDDASVFLPGDPPQHTAGKAAVRDAFRRTYGRRRGAISISLADVHVRTLGDMAVVTAHLGPVPALPVDQPTSFARRTFVLRRAGQRWLIVHLHASNVLLTPPR